MVTCFKGLTEPSRRKGASDMDHEEIVGWLSPGVIWRNPCMTELLISRAYVLRGLCPFCVLDVWNRKPRVGLGAYP